MAGTAKIYGVGGIQGGGVEDRVGARLLASGSHGSYMLGAGTVTGFAGHAGGGARGIKFIFRF